MQRLVAESRHWELTQHLYELGDEVADYIEHVAQAIADWDCELVYDCMDELEEIIADDRADARITTAELAGLRRALIAGLRAGHVSGERRRRTSPEPARLDVGKLEDDYPLQGAPMHVLALGEVLQGRSERVLEHLRDVRTWVLESTAYVATHLDAASLPIVFQRALTSTQIAADAWLDTVGETHPSYVRSMRGHHPPEFLAERAWAEAIAEEVFAARANHHAAR